MPLLGGLFTRTAGKQSSTSSSITTSPPDGSSLSLSSPTATSASSPTAEYVSFMAAGPSSPNGHGLAYAGEPPKRRPMGFFGRKKSGPTAVQPDSPNPRPAYLSRLSTASERPPLTLMTTSASSPTDGTLRPPPHMYNHSTRSLPPTRPSPSATTLGSPLAPSVSPTSTRTAPKSRTQGKAAGKRFAFWGRGGCQGCFSGAEAG
ncbi:hypothetical protein FB45DRAFT_223720 [Roridomyces roridus]|uniref:Uncharacterized protein n=1 Tax=Roridomyces roridus TaxID=1738132 RepID=A0AAD7BDD4_9AGAR|nr:hypothetical protein FB45DRAFT_223720 [Roridomyces roridus]